MKIDLSKLSKESLAEIMKQKEEESKKEMYIVRTYSAGVFYGEIEKREGMEVTMRNARRIWSWSGAASLSQLAMEGTKKPNDCKVPCPVDKVILTQAIEILDTTKAAQDSIEGIPVWKQ